MSEILDEIKDELYNSIENLRDLFEDYDFNTIDGHSSGDLDGIDGFKLVAVKDDVLLSFSKFKKSMKYDFFSNSDDVAVSDFEWDALENQYNAVCESYTAYQVLYESIEDNLTGDQTVESVELLDKEDLMERLLTLMLEENMIYEVEHPEKGIFYIANAELEEKIKE